MKTHNVELLRLKSMSNGSGLIEAQVDAQVTPLTTRADEPAASVLTMSIETARVLQALLKTQLADVDARKGRSQR